jgi:hypothetical protein
MSFPSDLHDKFEAVYERVTNGRHDMKHVKEYMQSRAHAEK